MGTGATVLLVLGVLIIFTFIKHAIFSTPKWKAIYFSIVDDINRDEEKDIIKFELEERYNLTPEQSEEAYQAAKKGDIDWFEANIKDDKA